MQNAATIEDEIMILTAETVSILISENPDSLTLYMFYYLTAKRQKTNQVFATNSFCMKGLGWGRDKLSKAKNTLNKYKLIKLIKSRNKEGKYNQTYVKVNYIWKSSTTNEIAQVYQNRSVDEPAAGKSTTNALSKNNKMLKVKKVNKKFEEFWELYPKKVDKKRCFDKYKKLEKEHEDVIAGLKNYLRYREYLETRNDFVPQIKNPLTFLNGRNWEDEYQFPSKKHDKLQKKTTEFIKEQDRTERISAAASENLIKEYGSLKNYVEANKQLAVSKTI